LLSRKIFCGGKKSIRSGIAIAHDSVCTASHGVLLFMDWSDEHVVPVNSLGVEVPVVMLQNREFPRAFFIVSSPNAKSGPVMGPASTNETSQKPNAGLPSSMPEKTDSDPSQESTWSNMIQRIEGICAARFNQKPPDFERDCILSPAENRPKSQ
jgi:hypothetical protein